MQSWCLFCARHGKLDSWNLELWLEVCGFLEEVRSRDFLVYYIYIYIINDMVINVNPYIDVEAYELNALGCELLVF